MSDLVLALDTSTPRLTTALLRRNGTSLTVLATREAAPPTIVSTLVPGVFGELFAEAGVSRDDLAVLVTGLGPGLFTGVRVAVATMKALAYARQLPLLGAESLEAMSLAALRGGEAGAGEVIRGDVDEAPELLCPVLDARKGEVYYALHAVEQERIVRRSDPAAGPPAVLADALRGRAESVRVFGSGVDVLQPLLEGVAHVRFESTPRYPGAAELAALAVLRDPSPAFSLEDVLALEPTYLRPPEAEVARQKKLAAQRQTGSA